MINAKDFKNREHLETHVSTLDMNSVLIEDRVITGTMEELKVLHLSHGQTVYDMRVIASDYQVSNATPQKKRGEGISRLDGRAINL